MMKKSLIIIGLFLYFSILITVSPFEKNINSSGNNPLFSQNVSQFVYAQAGGDKSDGGGDKSDGGGDKSDGGGDKSDGGGDKSDGGGDKSDGGSDKSDRKQREYRK